jgi:hypothetical protein
MHRKLAFVPAVLAIAIGSATAAQAAVAPAAVSGVMRAPRPAAMLGRDGIGATGTAAPQRRLVQHRGLRREGDQRSLPDRATPATGTGGCSATRTARPVSAECCWPGGATPAACPRAAPPRRPRPDRGHGAGPCRAARDRWSYRRVVWAMALP